MAPAPRSHTHFIGRLLGVLVVLGLGEIVAPGCSRTRKSARTLPMDVRGLVLAAGVGLERVPLPHSLLDGVETAREQHLRSPTAPVATAAPRRRRRRTSGRTLAPSRRWRAARHCSRGTHTQKRRTPTQTERISSPMKSAAETVVSISSHVTSRMGPLMPKSIGFSSSA